MPPPQPQPIFGGGRRPPVLVAISSSSAEVSGKVRRRSEGARSPSFYSRNFFYLLNMTQTSNFSQTKVQNTDKSTESRPRMESCRRIVSLFPQDAIPPSVYGDNFFLAASVVFETKNECGTMNRNSLSRSIKNWSAQVTMCRHATCRCWESE